MRSGSVTVIWPLSGCRTLNKVLNMLIDPQEDRVIGWLQLQDVRLHCAHASDMFTSCGMKGRDGRDPPCLCFASVHIIKQLKTVV